jgi:hypothetical protein
MRTIDEIIADSQKFGEAGLREAFEAGRASAHLELKSKVSAFFSEIMGPFETQPQEVQLPHMEEPQHGEQHSDGDYN